MQLLYAWGDQGLSPVVSGARGCGIEVSLERLFGGVYPPHCSTLYLRGEEEGEEEEEEEVVVVEEEEEEEEEEGREEQVVEEEEEEEEEEKG